MPSRTKQLLKNRSKSHRARVAGERARRIRQKNKAHRHQNRSRRKSGGKSKRK